MRRPRSVIAAAGSAVLSAVLVVVLWTAVDFAISTVSAPPPPRPPDGVSAAEWERVLASPSPAPEPDPLTYLDAFARIFDALSIAVPLAAVVLWLTVAVAAVRGSAWSRTAAVAVAAGQTLFLPVHAAGSAPAALVATWVAVLTGVTTAALLLRPESAAYFATASARPATGASLT